PGHAQGQPAPAGSCLRTGASTIYREQGKRLIAVKFSVRGRDLAGAVAEAQERTADLFGGAYRAEWSGEFEQMQKAEGRLAVVLAGVLGLILGVLYVAVHSVLDVVTGFSNAVGAATRGV